MFCCKEKWRYSCSKTNKNRKTLSCIFQLFDKDNCDEDDCLKTIKENMKNDKSGYFNYNLDNEKFMLNYQPLGVNDWYVFLLCQIK